MTNFVPVKEDLVSDLVIYSKVSTIVCDGHNLSSAHPRIYLSLEKTGCTVCPYCSCKYFLEETDGLN